MSAQANVFIPVEAEIWQENLPGYKAFMQKTCCLLFAGLW